MTEQKQEPDEIEHSLFALVENDADREPDLKALAELLRSDEPLDAGARFMLAELLDPKDLRFFNWRLRPAYTGARAEVIENCRQLAVMRAALHQHGSPTSAIQYLSDPENKTGLPAKGVRSLWQLRKRVKAEDQARERFDARFKLVGVVLRDGLRVMSEAFSHLNDKK